ncbi:MAG: 7-cyano-7-deazaguanine synthase QueC [Candidatus Altiarchaeota archaeon]
MKKKAICLLSGGLDSAVTTAIASQNYEIFALTFLYGQKHKKELNSAKRLAKFFKVKEHKILKIPLQEISSSSLINKKEKIPIGKSYKEIKKSKVIPTTYVAARNIIFLAYALAYAEEVNAEKIFIGANQIDYSHYPDCRKAFIEKFQDIAKVGTKAGVEGKCIEIEAPLLKMSKAEIIKKGHELKVPFELTWSCYQGRKKACGVCESCILRLDGFKKANLKDPLEYEKRN